ncbi:MAG: hypothetical protein CMJ05_01530 [Pelagibacterales bacterium]|nr:hypothetical protein [Pelagibacterales bacterium]
MIDYTFYSDLILGILLYFILGFYYVAYSFKEFKFIVFFQIVFLFFLLLTTHFYAFSNFTTYPGLGADSMNYDIWSKYLSEQFKLGIFDLDLSNIKSMSMIEYNQNADVKLVSYIPFGFVLPLSFIYFIFGYLPFFAKVFNVFLFVATSKLFYLFLNEILEDKKSIKITFILFAFCFPLLISSVSFTKEIVFMYGFIGLIRYTYTNRFIKAIPFFTLAVLVRPYTPILYILVFALFNRDLISKNKFSSLLSLFVFLLFFSFFNFQTFNIFGFILETNFAVYFNPFDTNQVIYVKGVAGLIKLIFSSPFTFLEFIVNALITALTKPDFWHLPNLTYSNIYLNAGKIDFSSFFYYLHSFSLLYINFFIVKFFIYRKYISKNFVSFEIISFLFIVLGVIFLVSLELRYIIMSTYPILLILFSKIKTELSFYKNKSSLIIYILSIIFLMVFPIFI